MYRAGMPIRRRHGRRWGVRASSLFRCTRHIHVSFCDANGVGGATAHVPYNGKRNISTFCSPDTRGVDGASAQVPCSGARITSTFRSATPTASMGATAHVPYYGKRNTSTFRSPDATGVEEPSPGSRQRPWVPGNHPAGTPTVFQMNRVGPIFPRPTQNRRMQRTTTGRVFNIALPKCLQCRRLPD